MYDIPHGFTDLAIGDVKTHFFFDRNKGIHHPEEYYFILGAENIWDSYICWKNQDSAKGDLSFLTCRDIEYGCKRNGIPCFHDGNDLFVRMENMTYIFVSSWPSCFGGPVGSDKEYHRNMFLSSKISFSTGALFRFLKWFDNAIPKFREQTDAAVDVFGRQFKRAQILQAGAEQILEPGLEDVPYRYSFRSDEEDRLDIWVYYDYYKSGWFGDIVRLSFRYEEYTGNPQFIKYAVKSLAQDKDSIGSYIMWATDPVKNDEWCPEYSNIKNAGLFAFYNKT